MIRLRLQPDGHDEPVDVRLEQADRNQPDEYIFESGDESIELQVDRLGPGRGRLRIRGEILPYFTAVVDRQIHVWIAGRNLKFSLVDRAARRAGTRSAMGIHEQVVAPMPGTVLRVEVAPGDTFEAHQPLVIMESMKMETTLSVPHPGEVREVACRPGDLVEMGAVLVKLKPAKENAAPGGKTS